MPGSWSRYEHASRRLIISILLQGDSGYDLCRKVEKKESVVLWDILAPHPTQRGTKQALSGDAVTLPASGTAAGAVTLAGTRTQSEAQAQSASPHAHSPSSSHAVVYPRCGVPEDGPGSDHGAPSVQHSDRGALVEHLQGYTHRMPRGTLNLQASTLRDTVLTQRDTVQYSSILCAVVFELSMRSASART